MACNEMWRRKTANKQAEKRERERIRTDGQQEEGSQGNMPHVVYLPTENINTHIFVLYTNTNYQLSVSGGQSHSAPRVELYVRVSLICFQVELLEESIIIGGLSA